MASQKISFVAMPRGVTLDGDPLPISVLVTPRLYGGEERLDAYPDWLGWAPNLAARGLRLTLEIGGVSSTLEIDRNVLQPALWSAIFRDTTFVRSHVFQDYSAQPIVSYPVAGALGAMRDIYRQAGVQLALPMPRFERGGTLRGRRLLRDLLGGIRLPRDPAVVAQPGTQLDMAMQFANYHSAPTGAPIEERPPDFERLIDFHQALSSLSDFPALQRALGLVFDLSVPAGAVPHTANGQPLTIAVTAAEWGEGEWAQPPAIARLDTAYFYQALENGQLAFMTAPKSWGLNDNVTPAVFGLLDLGHGRFGLAQVDVDGGMHKLLNLAAATESLADGPALPQHPEVFDPDATLPALRSGGISLFLSERAAHLLNTTTQSQAFNFALENDQPQPRPFYAEDLVRGHRLDVWDTRTGDWHSLHRRNARYQLEDQLFETADEEGFVQLAATQAAPEADGTRKNNAIYLHEAVARWAGWSLSVPMPGKHLTRHADPNRAVPVEPGADGYDQPNAPATPFKMATQFHVVAGSLPSLRFGRAYRLRARAVDLAGNSLHLDTDRPLLDELSPNMALPGERSTDGVPVPYLRFEPVAAPVVLAREELAVSGPGSGLERLVIRSFNGGPEGDAVAADTSGGDRHLAPPRTSVELAERMGMFDDENGKLRADPDTYALIAARDGAEFQHVDLLVANQTQSVPLEPAERLEGVPYIPDLLARGAALRDLPGTPGGTRAAVTPDTAAGPVDSPALPGSLPRPGSATLVSFGAAGDWQHAVPLRLALADGQGPPEWDPQARVLTVRLPKGQTAVVPLSSYVLPGDLKLMGVWAWIREQIEATDSVASGQWYRQLIQHLLQRAVEGGHWMITPPQLLTLVHAVQQPVGVPELVGLTLEVGVDPHLHSDLQTAPSLGASDPAELAPITAWRRPGSNEAFLVGGLRIHGASTSKIELLAEWQDLDDDIVGDEPNRRTPRSATADTLALPHTGEGLVYAQEHERRAQAYYDRERDLLAFARLGDALGEMGRATIVDEEAAPRHQLGDTRRRRVSYRAVASSRYREYFAQDQGLDFTRASAPVVVDVPASARPAAPDVAYIIPTFGWQRERDTNVARSLRTGGLRVYLRRPWHSSGEGELLGATTWSYRSGTLDDAARERWKPYISQWGMDPIWNTGRLSAWLDAGSFPDAAQREEALSIDGMAGVVDVAGHSVGYDAERKLWYCDLSVSADSDVYAPFVRLALARYQPHALADAKLSRIVLAEFVQLTPDRAATVTADPYNPRRVRVVVSGVAPRGPLAQARVGRIAVSAMPTEVSVRVQRRVAGLQSDLAWEDAPDAAALGVFQQGPNADDPHLSLWDGVFRFKDTPEPGMYRLAIEERESISAEYTVQVADGQLARLAPPSRLIYAEFVELDGALLGLA
jgi:hypothetical protein